MNTNRPDTVPVLDPVPVVGFAGRAGAGKTLAAEVLVRRLGAVRRPFAEPLKRIAQQIYALSDEQVYGRLKDVLDERYGLTPRYILQRLGTEVGRAIHPDTWVFAWENALRQAADCLVVADDVRFDNEAQAIHRLGGMVFLVSRRLPAADDEHPSERGIHPALVDQVLDNNGSPEQLEERLLWLVVGP